jgi:hypothetical protein
MRAVAHGKYLYELWTGLYMLDPWEKALFSALARALPPRCKRAADARLTRASFPAPTRSRTPRPHCRRLRGARHDAADAVLCCEAAAGRRDARCLAQLAARMSPRRARAAPRALLADKGHAVAVIPLAGITAQSTTGGDGGGGPVGRPSSPTRTRSANDPFCQAPM